MNNYSNLRARKDELESKRTELRDKYNLDWISGTTKKLEFCLLAFSVIFIFTTLFLNLFTHVYLYIYFPIGLVLSLSYSIFVTIRDSRRKKCRSERMDIDSEIEEIEGKLREKRQEERRRKRRERKKERREKKQWWLSMSPRQFEKEVGELYESKGWNVQVTSESNDRGYDLRIRSDGETGLVECKQRRLSSNVGRPSVQKLAGAIMGENVDRGILVTTGGFTSGAEDFARKVDIELVDGEDLIRLASDLPV